MADRYFTPDLDPLARSYHLEGPELHHFRTVCRGKSGAHIELFDGRGQVASGTVVQLERRSAVIEIHSRNIDPPPTERLTLATGIPKGDRGTFLVEKITELGVTELLPLQTARTVTDPKQGKLARFERSVIEACKQSGRTHLLSVASPTPWDQVVQRQSKSKWLLDPRGDTLPERTSIPEIVAIGPEGGWTDEEVGQATDWGWTRVQLPGDVLRVETAAIAVAAWWRIHSSDRSRTR